MQQLQGPVGVPRHQAAVLIQAHHTQAALHQGQRVPVVRSVMEREQFPSDDADLVLARHDDVLRLGGRYVGLDLQRVRLYPRDAVGAEDAVVLLHAQRSPSQLACSNIHWQ
ncbi:hypothetical protein EYF80_005933 [Liparis tanakae]|uniref:Uncharacterized protein n=1 Tax=Liparis tanakae TaxID=230148 RepID=A0A4Z2J142_9TELE|nr:hypothetical protein EYF80_005933 [Liparis tanakae]